MEQTTISEAIKIIDEDSPLSLALKTDPVLANIIKEEVEATGINFMFVGRKPRTKWMIFVFKAYFVAGYGTKFYTKNEAMEYKQLMLNSCFSKMRIDSTIEESEETSYLNQMVQRSINKGFKMEKTAQYVQDAWNNKRGSRLAEKIEI